MGLGRGMRAVVVVGMLAGMASGAQAASLPPAADSGIAWLQSQLQTNGSLANENLSIATPLQARSETAAALGLAGPIPASILGAVTADTGSDTESLARRIDALVQAGQDPTGTVQLLFANQNADGGFGSEPGDSSDSLDTAWALLALRQANSTNATALGNGLQYLLGSVNADGGYGLPASGSGSEVYVTAYVLLAYQAYDNAYPLSPQISGAHSWLISQQANGVYADTLSDAIAAIALAASSTDAAAYSAATTALAAGQQSDGSWSEDPYLTALAVRALAATANQPVTPTAGGVTGLVLDAGSHQPIAGAQVSLSGQSSTTVMTAGGGSFTASNLAPGSYSASAGASGYGSITVQNIKVTAGAVTNVGTLLLTANPTTANIAGKITDGSTGLPLAGATIAVSGGDTATTASASDGSYSLTGLAPGAVTLTVSLSGYNPASAGVSLAAGESLSFSPALYATTATNPPTSATLTGTVLDAASKAPLAGATITVGSASAQADGSGNFALANLSAGPFQASIAAMGYTGTTLSGTLANGTDSAGTIYLSAIPPTSNVSNVSGVITDAGSKNPIAGATVQVQGTSLSVITGADGSYQIGNIPGDQFSVYVSAPGYISQTGNISLTAPGAATASVALVASAPAASGGIVVKNLSLEHNPYIPYADDAIGAEIDNTSSGDIGVILTADVLDAQDDVVAEIQAVHLGLNNSPADATRVVPANGSLNQTFDANLKDIAPGTYQVVVRATDAAGDVLAEQGTVLTVDPVTQVGGNLVLDPPITQAGIKQPVTLNAAVFNRGNVPLNAGPLQLTVTLKDTGAGALPPVLPEVAVYSGDPLLQQPRGTGFDSAGNLYTLVANANVAKVAPNGAATTYATLPYYSYQGYGAYLYPVSLAVDPSGTPWMLNTSQFVFKVGQNNAFTAYHTGLDGQNGLDIDSAGDVYLTGSQGGDHVVAMMNPAGQTTYLVRNGLSTPQDLTADASGNLYAVNYGDGSISRIGAGGAITRFASGLSHPRGIAMGGNGDLYVANSGANDVVQVTPAGLSSTFASGLSDPMDLQFGPDGSLYVLNGGNNTISILSPAGQVTSTLASPANNVQGTAYDGAGNLYMANAGNNTLTEISAAGAISVLSTNLSGPRAVATDASGDVYVANWTSGTVTKFAAGTQTTLGSGLSGPYGVAPDGAGNVYVTESRVNRISMITAGGAVQHILDSPVSNPGDMILGTDGVPLLANNTFISRLPVAGGSSTVFSQSGSVRGLAQLQDGSLYYTDPYDIFKVNTANNTSQHIASIPYTYDGFTSDGVANFYVTDYNNHRIVKVDLSGNVTNYAQLTGTPWGLVRDTGGYLYTVVNGVSLYKIAPDGSSTLLATLPNDQHELTQDANGGLLVSNLNKGTVSAVAADGTVTTLLTALSQPTGLAMLPDGSIAVAEALAQRVRVFTRSGTVLQNMYGFSNPEGAVWNGSQLVFCDQYSRAYTLVPGQYPQFFAQVYDGPGYLSAANGNEYVSNGYTDYVISPTGTVTQQPYPNRYGGFTSVAARSDGSFALAGGNQIVVVNAAQQVTSTYAGFSQPVSLAVDTASNVYVADQNGDLIIKIPAAGGPTSVYAGMNTAPFKARFSPSGTMYITGGNGIYAVGANGSATPFATAPCCASGVQGGIAFVGTNIYASDSYAQMVRVVAGSNLPPYAMGIANPTAIRVGPDGAIYIGDASTGSVLRYTQNGLSMFATGMRGPASMGFDSHGTLFVGSGNGFVYSVTPSGTVTDLGVSNTLYGQTVDGLVVDSAGEPLLTMYGQNVIDRLILPVPQSLPPAGTVVYTTTVDAPALPAGDSGANLSFGNWTPPYGGDYTVTVTSTQSGVGGQLVDALHVGPNATGTLSADRSQLPPGNQSVNLDLNVQGADFTSLAKVYPANLQLAVATGTQSYPLAMGSDAAGDVYFMDINGNLKQVSTNGTITTLMSGLVVTGDEVPVDSQQNVYVAKLVSGKFQILSLSPSGSVSTVATLSGAPYLLAMTADDKLYTAIGGDVIRVFPDGTTKIVYSGPGFASLTTDGQGSLYVDYGTCNTYCDVNAAIVKIAPDGTVTTLANDLFLEFESKGNITGDCSDNLFVTPRTWLRAGIPANYNEEVYLVELVGSTGQPSLVFNSLGVAPGLADMDFITYDRFHSDLVIWTDDNNGQMFKLPISCGAIDTEAQVVTQPGQTLTGFNVAPTATLGNADGSTEYVWDMKAVNASGQDLQFGTVLNHLGIGQTQSVVKSAALVFKNSFVADDVTVPLTVPNIQVAPAVNLTAATDAPSYPANATVNVTVGLADTFSTPASGNLDIQVLDASNTLVMDLGPQPVSVNPSSTLNLTAQWNTGAYLNGNYSVKAVLTGPDGATLAQGSAPFAIGATSTAGGNSLLTVGVTTDKASYAPTDTVNLDDRLINVTSNALDSGITVVTTVTGPSGAVIWSNTGSVMQLVPGALKDLPLQLPLANAAPGNYSVSVTATLNGTALPPATAGFSVQSSAATASGVTGTLSATPAQAPLTSVVTLSGSLSNNGNAAISGATATLAVLDPVAGQLVFQSPVNVASLVQGQSLPLQATWTAAGTVNQTYVALLMAKFGGVTKTLAQVNIKLLDPTAALTGSLNVSPTQVQLTSNLSLTASVTNGGPQVSGLSATLSIQDPTGATVFSSPAGIGSLAQGQVSQLLANWVATGPINQMYTATLSVADGAYSKTLATQPFEVIPPPIKLGVSMSGPAYSRLLVLLNCPEGDDEHEGDHSNPSHGQTQAHDDGGDGHDHQAACLTSRSATLNSLLTGLNVSYKLTTDIPSFMQALRSGRYNQYWVLGALPDGDSTNQVSEELEEAVNRGDSLLVDGELDGGHNPELLQIVGASYKGPLPENYQGPASLLAPVFTPASLPTATGDLRFVTTTGSEAASYSVTLCDDEGREGDDHTQGNQTHDGHDHDHHSCSTQTVPAIITNAYGQGHAAILGLDLLATLQQNPSSGWQTAVSSLLQYLLPPVPASVPPLGYVPVTTTVQNQGIAVTLKVTDVLPTGATEVDANPTPTSTNPVSWIAPLAVNQSLTFQVGITVPANAGNYQLISNVGTLDASNVLTPYGSLTFPLTVQDTATLESQLSGDLAALTPSGTDQDDQQERIEHAQHEYQEALTLAQNQKWDDAIEELLEASEDLESLGTQATTARLDLDHLIQALELQWYASGATYSIHN